MKNSAGEEKEARDRILKAAKSEFAARGFQGARMAAIADEAGFNKSLIHYYFGNKESLYFEILENMVGLSDSEYDVPVFMGSVSLTNPQKIYMLTYLIVMSHFRASDSEVNDILLWEIAEGGEFLRKINETYMIPRMKLILKLINDVVEQGEFQAQYPELIIQGLLSMALAFRVELQRKFKPTLFELDGAMREDMILSFFIDYMFRMLRPADRPLDIPEVPVEILRYIDKLIEIMQDHGISEKIVEALMDIIISR